jgi:hypothetical protein
MSQPRPDIRLVSCTFLDAWNVTITVRECWAERRWLRVVQREQVKSYDLAIRVGRFLDASTKSYVLRQDPRHFRLWELFGAWRMSQKFNTVVGIPAESPLL